MSSDHHLAERLIQGDGDASRIVLEWIRTVVGVHKARLGHRVDDLAQDIAVELLVAIRKRRFRGESQFRTFVGAFARYRCIDQLRLQARQSTLPIEDLHERPSQERSPYETLAAADTLRHKLAGLRRTPTACQELWRLLAEGLPYPEIAEQLGISVGTLRVRISRCRQQARSEAGGPPKE